MSTFIIDGKNCLFRHNHTSNLKNRAGKKISGAYGMFKDIKAICEIHKPNRLIVCWDIGRSPFRLELYPEYKGNRKNDDQEFLENIKYQTDVIRQMLGTLPVIQIGVRNTEADDVIGFLCEKLQGEKTIFSNDTDFYQLLSEDVDILKPKTKKIFTYKDAEKELGFPVSKYVLWKSIVGDNSDNIKGCKGIGPVNATKIITGKIKKPLDKEVIKRNMKLIKIAYPLTDEDKVEIVNQFRAEKIKKPNTGYLMRLFQEHGFNSLLFNFENTVHPFKRLLKE